MKKKTAMLIRDRAPSNHGIVLDGELNNHNCIIQVDPGATKSYISQAEIHRLGLKAEPLTPSHEILIASGDKLTVTEKIDARIKINNYPCGLIKETLYVLPG